MNIKKKTMLCQIFGTVACVAVLSANLFAETISKEEFQTPLNSARPHTWWHWMNGNVSRDGITKDLEAMRQIGLGGFQAFHVTDKIPAGPVGYLSDAWRELMQHTVKEADRLGLEMCLHNCAGWSSSGGPWITPELAMQSVVQSELRVSGPTSGNLTLAEPKGLLGYYRDISVIAFPTPLSEPKKGTGFRLDRWKLKAGYNYYSGSERDAHLPKGSSIDQSQVIDLTDRLQADGTLDWQVPNGDWTILRFGHTPTGRKNRPAPPEGCGLECDKLSKKAAQFHWDHSVQKVLDDIGPLAGKTLNNVLVDSFEVHHQNWTSGFENEFLKRRGYAITPFLPVLTGRVVDSIDVSERFLWDFRRTVADLFSENYFGHFATMCHENGLQLSIEPYRPKNFDVYQVAAQADIPMGEFWVGHAHKWVDPTLTLASSAAHAYGRKYVGAESFTAGGRSAAWTNSPYMLKTLGDHNFCLGLNRIIFHTFVHQPWPDHVLPGMTMGPHGMQMNRNNTWFKKSGPWIDYLARCQYLLQQGQAVVDICYLESENAPNLIGEPDTFHPVPPEGYDYDVLSVAAMMDMRVEEGVIVTASGMRYRVLVLPNDQRMRPYLLRQLKELVSAGATVWGPQPSASPSLENYPACNTEVSQLGNELWGSEGGIATEQPLDQLLRDCGMVRDFEVLGNRTASEQPFINFFHRRVEGTDVYFVSNQLHQPMNIEALFRVTGKQPELWCPETGKVEPVLCWSQQEGNRTAVTLRLEAAESVFVVFRETIADTPHVVSGSDNVAPLFATEITPSDVHLTQAVYGVIDGDANQQVDVTQPLRDQLRNGEPLLRGTNALAGDPAHRIVKELRLEYEVRGVAFQKNFRENEAIRVDQLGLAPPTAAPTTRLQANQGQVKLQAFSGGKYEFQLSNGQKEVIELTDPPTPILVDGPWQIELPQLNEESASLTTNQLQSLSEFDLPAAKYFAGTATYRTRFEVPSIPSVIRTSRVLTLGNIEVIGEVELNGKSLPLLWKPPYELDITDAIRTGSNELVIRVTTLWPNRLIGDARLRNQTSKKSHGPEEIPSWLLNGTPRSETPGATYTTWSHWNANDELLPAGLIGPVTVHTAYQVPLEE